MVFKDLTSISTRNGLCSAGSVRFYDLESTSERASMSTIIEASPLEKKLPQEPLPTGDSCVLVIFGASGDLTKRKLVPGLYNLAVVGCMNPQFEVLGIRRTPTTT